MAAIHRVSDTSIYSIGIHGTLLDYSAVWITNNHPMGKLMAQNFCNITHKFKGTYHVV